MNNLNKHPFNRIFDNILKPGFWFSDLYPYPKNMDSFKKLPKSVLFPFIERFVKVYSIEFEDLESEQNNLKASEHSIYIKELEGLKQFLNNGKVKSISIRTGASSFNVESGILINKLLVATYKESVIAYYDLASADGKRIKNKQANKQFIINLHPLFEHLKNHNPNLSNLELYSFLREFIDILGFNFAERYPTSDEEQIFKSYFSNI